MRYASYISLFIAFLSIGTLHAQNPQFSQFYSAQQYLNPALTGNTYQDRVALNFRQQWAAAHKPFQSFAFGYDHKFADRKSGIGLMAVHDQAGTHDLSFTMVAVSYAYNLRLNRRKNLRFGMRAGYVNKSYDPTRLLFADQVIQGDNAPSIEPFLLERSSYADISSGALIHTKQSWFGVAVDHLNTPNQTLIMNETTALPMMISVHGGHRFDTGFRKGKISDASSYTLTGVYKSQAKWDQIDIGAYITKNEISAGLWYRGLPGLKAYSPGQPNNDAIVSMIGCALSDQIRFAYSYDLTISRLTPSSGGAHEISLVVEWPKQRKRRRYHMVPCPKF